MRFQTTQAPWLSWKRVAPCEGDQVGKLAAKCSSTRGRKGVCVIFRDFSSRAALF